MSTNPESVDPKQIVEDDKPTHAIDAPGETGERRRTHHDIPDHGHNPSAQKDVDTNPDLTLHYSHEHQHKHLHHNRASLAGRHDEVLYAAGTTFDKSNIGDQGPQDYQTHQLRQVHNQKSPEFVGDAEKGGVGPTRLESNGSEDDGRKHRVSGTYSKYKIFVHLFIWLLFTG